MPAQIAKSRIKTDAQVRAIRPDPDRQTEYRIEGVRALALRVSPAGAKTWTLRYRTKHGEQRRTTLGNYPEVGLSDARSQAEIVLGGVAAGADPAKERRAAKVAAGSKKLSTVSGLLDAYFADAEAGRHRPNARPKRASTMAMERGYADRFLRPRFGKVPMSELTRHEVQRLINGIAEDSPATARITRNVVRQAFNYALRQEIVDRNPAALVDVAREESRERVLTDVELCAIWRAATEPTKVEDLDLAPATGQALCFALLTLQRGGEVCGIHARELSQDARLWTIPGSRTKNHRTHVVPLSDAAMSVLGQAFGGAEKWTGFAFPSPRSPKKHIERRALTRGMARLRNAVGVVDATPHDFRRTGSTRMTGEDIGVSRFIVSRVLNQISDTGGAAAVTGVYDRNEYLPEKRRALEAWAALLANIVSGAKRPKNVIPLKMSQK